MAQGVRTPYPDLAHRDSPGKPTLCTPIIIEGVATAVRTGMYPGSALAAMDISESCHSNWLDWARRDYESGNEDSVFCQYSKAVKRAEAEWQSLKVRQLESVHRRVADDRPELWASVTTSLERRLPDLYGKRERQEAPTHATQVNISFAPFPGVTSQPGPVVISTVPAPDRAALDESDTGQLGQSPPRICAPTDTGGE